MGNSQFCASPLERCGGKQRTADTGPGVDIVVQITQSGGVRIAPDSIETIVRRNKLSHSRSGQLFRAERSLNLSRLPSNDNKPRPKPNPEPGSEPHHEESSPECIVSARPSGRLASAIRPAFGPFPAPPVKQSSALGPLQSRIEEEDDFSHRLVHQDHEQNEFAAPPEATADCALREERKSGEITEGSLGITPDPSEVPKSEVPANETAEEPQSLEPVELPTGESAKREVFCEDLSFPLRIEETKNGSSNSRASASMWNLFESTGRSKEEKKRKKPAELTNPAELPITVPCGNIEAMCSPIELSPHVYFKGELMKYHPGFSAQYIKRYCQAAKGCFRYYKGQSDYDMYPPLAAAWYRDIESVQRVSAKSLSAPRGKAALAPKQRFLFEVVMRPGCTSANKGQRSVLGGTTRVQNACEDFAGTVSLESKKESLEHSRALSSNLIVPPSKTDSVTSQKDSVALSPVTRNKKVYVDKVQFETEEEARDYIAYVKAHGIALVRAKKWDRSSAANLLKARGAVTGRINRDIDSYASDEKMLFAAVSAEECERWVWVLNWLLHSQQQ